MCALYLCALITAGFQLTTLSLNPDNRVFYSPNNSHLIQLEKFESKFESFSNVSFLITSVSSIDRELADAIRWLDRQLPKLPGYVRSHSLANYPHVESDDESIDVRTSLDAICEEGVCEITPGTLDYLPEITRRFLSPDRKSVAVIAALDVPVGDAEKITHISHEISRIQSSFRSRYPQFQISHTGAIPMMQAFVDASQRDFAILLPASFATMIALAYFFLGSLRYVLAIVCIASSNIIFALAAASLLDISLNSATSTLPLALLIISISTSIHLFGHMSSRLSEGNKHSSLYGSALQVHRTPTLLASLTTIFGLASLSLVDIPPFREFGVLGSIGVAANYVTVAFVIGPLLAPIAPPARARFQLGISKYINKYAYFVDRQTLPLIPLVLFCTLAVCGLAFSEFDEDYVEFFDESHEFRQGADLVSEKMASPYSIDISIRFEEPGTPFKPAAIEAVAALQEKVRKNPKVANTLSYLNGLKRAARALDDRGISLSARKPEELEQIFLAYQMSLPEGHSDVEFLDFNRETVRISVLLNHVSTSEIRAFIGEVSGIWESLEKPNAAQLHVVGESIPLAFLSREAINQVSIGIAVCLLIAFLGSYVLTKSIRLTTISSLAICAPLLVSLGVWAWMGLGFGIATSLVLAVTIGIVVDDVIHFMYRFVYGVRTQDLSDSAAIGYAIHHSGRGIIASSIILIVGFSLLSLSSFAVNRYFGLGVSLAIASALVFTLFVLPSILQADTTNKRLD